MELFRIFIHDSSFSFILEIILRCIIMYLMIIIFLRFSGKRGVRQLSIFEIAIILCLGSIAGDPMFTEDLPLIQALTVFVSILVLYRCTTYLTMKSKKIESLLEGKPMYIVQDGMLVLEGIKNEKYSYDEFFSEMRQQQIEHLGQIKIALLETEGCLSLIPFHDSEVKWGLPIFPDEYKQTIDYYPERFYSCMFCGNTRLIKKINEICERCQKQHWVLSINTKRSK
ncbi:MULTISPECIES: DUF421 domain-containing protein [Acinetobacter]|uniref:DUF421 domain-containing protein n=1 Tax=Acinetobacter piscicola TaxID=2006115 RepID=A0A7S6VW94_9GAMM|nr:MULTISPECIES: YetF domain-containing protein [Acinetobacter]MDM1758121.1 DUF421 domain-containing protein [Acinetobacter sp. 256-1]QOW46073.1 DUF421 domain-containing protein [Acinetobacter piscicola]